MKDSTDSILLKLNEALEADGDFPTRARVVSELQRMTSDLQTPVDKVVALLKSEPALATRLMHLTNSVYYGSSTPISTVSQAVVHLGLKSVYNLCANFVLLQRFTPLVGKHSAFADCFLMSLVVANLSSHLDGQEKGDDEDEEGYLAGSLFTLGPLLLGYYFPNLFTEARKRSERKRISIFGGVEELLGVSAVGVSLGVIDSLAIPELYKELLLGSYALYSDSIDPQDPALRHSSISVAAATKIGEAIMESKNAKTLEHEIQGICSKYSLNYDLVFRYLQALPTILHQQGELHEVSGLGFPSAYTSYIRGEKEEEKNDINTDSALVPYMEQLESAIAENETLASIIATVMEALNFACEFDRVVYLESDVDETKLFGKIGLGDDLPDLDSIHRILGPNATFSEKLDIKAYFSGSVELFGEPLFDDGWPYAALPVGSGDRVIGVIYADQQGTDEQQIDPQRSIALGVLADLLDRAVQKSRL